MAKLISMVDFLPKHPYSKFLKQQLEIWMFIPCKLVDGVWVVMEEPNEDNSKYWNVGLDGEFNHNQFIDEREEYQEAKDRVLFEGFEYNKHTCQIKDKDDLYFFFSERYCELYFEGSANYIEYIEEIVKYNLELTKTAKKQIELCKQTSHI